MSIKIKFNAEKCVGCYACHIACLDAHHEVDEADAKSFRAIRKVQKEGFEKNICPGCTHCGKCMEVCPVHAIYRDEKTGLILTDKELCVGCHVCENACPLQMIRFDVRKNGKVRRLYRASARRQRTSLCADLFCGGADGGTDLGLRGTKLETNSNERIIVKFSGSCWSSFQLVPSHPKQEFLLLQSHLSRPRE